MRELTQEELVLVAGGLMASSGSDDPWYYEAFDWLSTGLDWIGDIFGGWMDDYLDSFQDTIDEAQNTGDMMNCYDDWTDYAIDQQSNGDSAEDFRSWYDGIDPGTCDTDSGLEHQAP
jgi:hypothetical protein